MEKIAWYYLYFSVAVLLLFMFTMLGLYTYITYQMTLTCFPDQTWIHWIVLGLNIISILISVRLLILWFNNKGQYVNKSVFKLARLLFTIQFVIHVGMLYIFYLFAEMDDAPGLILVGSIFPFIISIGAVYMWLKEKQLNIIN